MKRLTIILMSMIFVIVLEPMSFAASSKTRQITGNVTAINTKTNTITVEKKSKEVVVGVRENTKIIHCAPKTTITDIKIGDKITVKYKQQNGKNTAKSVTIRAINQKDY